jgi:membrane fusion protein (multidrug efflux system)
MLRRIVGIAAVLALVGVGLTTINVVYRPRGVERSKARLGALERQMRKLDEESGKRQISADKRRREIEQEISRLAPGSTDGDANANATSGDGAVGHNVTVEVVVPREIRDVLTLPGVAEARDDVLLAARNGGTVEWIGPSEGDRVERGQEIARIDARALEQRMRAAQAAEGLAELDLSRFKDLRQTNVASQGELDRAESDCEQARAALAIARQDFDDATLRSPIDGVIDDILPDVGEFVDRGQTVARLVDVSRIKAVLSVPEKDVSYLRVGQAARVANPRPVGGATTGTITRLGLVADDASKTFRVEVTVDNAGGVFRPGMISDVELIRRNNDRAIVVPLFAALHTENGPLVYVEENGEAVARHIEIGIRQGMWLEVTNGLEAGDRLIVSGQRMLSDGARVRVVEDQP